MEPRDDSGRFTAKSDSERKVRSLRATDWVWDEFGFLASGQKITRADLLEQWVKAGGLSPGPKIDAVVSSPTPVEIAIAVQILTEALDLKANAGGAIKAKIREALKILQGG
jgi:hypothetical protein